MEAIQNGDKVIILSDRATSADRVPVSALLATGLVNDDLIAILDSFSGTIADGIERFNITSRALALFK
jgi:hypothetical protein